MCKIMRYKFLTPLIGLLINSFGFAQKPIAHEAIQLFQGRHAETFSIFNSATQSKPEFSSYVDGSLFTTVRNNVLHDFQNKKPGIFKLQLPSPINIVLDLFQVDVFALGASIMTSEGTSHPPNPDHYFYRGIIHGNLNSLAIVSILGDKIQILYSDATGNHRIQQTQDGNYIAFADQDILIPKQIECFTEDSGEGFHDHGAESSGRSMTGNCVEVYVEADYKSYQDNGSSVTNTEAWVTSLFNEVITLYANESIPVSVSDIFVYTSTDPYAGFTTTNQVLTAFTNYIDTLTYDGRLAHLLSTRTLGGGIAWLDVLCSTSSPCAFSASLSTTIVPVPTYSWNVEVVTHEMGHNMGSKHTHACAWNGNNTQIDDCGNQWAAGSGNPIEGSACYNAAAPIIPLSGTIMSYCHLVSGVGINFNNGFGTLPGDLIRNRYNTASCNTGTCTPPLCTTLTTPSPDQINVDINSDLVWIGSAGANGYKLTLGTSPNPPYILDNVNVGAVTTYNPSTFPYNTTMYVKIVPFNELGDASCSFQTFITEPDTPPLCTQLTYPQAGATNVPLTAVIQWAHSVGNQLGYKITIGTTPTGGQIANLLDVGNVTSYDPPGYLPHSSTIYVKITPYGALGDITGCLTQSFNTVVPVAGDFCNMAVNLPCGGSISGNTTTAYPDAEATTCGVTIQAPGIWYTFVGDGQNAIITTCSQYSYDTQLNAYSGSCSGLTCITGNDDFCTTGSRITFPTTNGTTYYVLVQGWGGQVGSYTVSRTCYSGIFYCQSGGRTANQEWIKTFSFAGFTKQTGSSHYSDYTNDIITLSRGGIYPVSITPHFTQTPNTEYHRVWIDLNKDGDFTDTGEQLFSPGGSQTTVSGNITIPVTTPTGTTRMRVAMKRNGTPSTCEVFDYGEVEDYTVSIRCNMVTVTTEAGNGSLRNVSMCADDNEPILFAPTLNNQTISLTTGPLVADGQWKWMPNINTNITIQASGVSRVLSIPVGKKVEMQNLILKGGTATSANVIDNDGTLILRNTTLQRAAGSSSNVLENSGPFTIEGTSQIKQ